MNFRFRQAFAILGMLAFALVAAAYFWAPFPAIERVAIQIVPASSTPISTSRANRFSGDAAKPKVDSAETTVRIYETAILNLERELTRARPKSPEKPQAKPNPKPPKPKAKKAAKAMQANATSPAPKRLSSESPSAGAAVPAARSGEWPGLIVDFSSIGFRRYAILTEKAGGIFFAYRGANGIGPRISFAEGKVSPSGDTANLAFDRPYLVSDPSVAEWLAGFDMPEGTSRSSVVVLWPKWLDRAVWSSVALTLAEGAAKPEQVKSIGARAQDASNGFDLRIESYALKDGDRRVSANEVRTIRVGR